MPSLLLPARLDALTFALPAVGALADSGRRLSAVAAEPLIPLVERIPGIAEAASSPGELVEREEAVLLSRGPADGTLAGLADLWSLRSVGSPPCWGYAGGLGGLLAGRLISHPVQPPSRESLRARHAGEDFRELLAAMEVPAPASWVPRLAVSEELRQTARERLERGGIPSGTSPLVAVIPGGRLSTRRSERLPRRSVWPWQRFADLAREVRRKAMGTRCVLVAGKEPLWQAVRIHMETARFVPVIGPDLDAAGIAGLLAVCDLAVGADSELLHLAAAVGTPTVALFGPTDPGRRAPQGEGHRVIEAPARDLRKLELPEVLEAVTAFLKT